MDAFTAKRYDVKSYPTFIVIEPISATNPTGKTTTWTEEAANRDFKGMKKWVKGFTSQLSPLSDTPGYSNRVKVAKPESPASEHTEHKPTAKLSTPKLVHAQAAATLENAQPVPSKPEDTKVDADSADPEEENDTSCCTDGEIPVQSDWIDSAHKHTAASTTGLLGKAKVEEHKKEATLKEPSKKVISSPHEDSKKEENKKVAAPITKQLNQIETELEHTNTEFLAMESSVKKMLSEQETSTKFVVEL